MTGDRDDSPHADGGDVEEEEPAIRANAGFGTTISAAQERIRGDMAPRTRSPTPPRALYRSTTGKGVAFTVDDIVFLIRFMEYRSCVLLHIRDESLVLTMFHIDHKIALTPLPFGRTWRRG